MNRERVLSYLEPEWGRMKAVLSESLSTDVGLLSRVNAGIIANGGKMLRPMMVLLLARACGSVSDDSVRYAAASELLHNATLLHDDVADSSLERRGRPTVNALLGPSTAVLVGDFWLSKAVASVVSTARYRDVADLFSQTLTDLAEGEMLQLEMASTGNTTLEDYYRIIYCKTASLFVSAAVSAAISAEASERYLEVAREYSSCFGMAFQIKDDILDYAGDSELGKPVGIDLTEQKITLPLLCAMENSPEAGLIRQKVVSIADDPSAVEGIRSFVAANDGIGKASKILDSYIDRAVRSLDVLPDSEARAYLVELARYNAFRRQ